MKLNAINGWLLKQTRLSGKSLTDTQIGQARARLAFAAAGLIYIWLHGEFFTVYGTYFLSVSVLYFLYNAISILRIRNNPVSTIRTVISPVFDIIVVCFGILVDGGQGSGIYFLFLVIIFGNGLRFGNAFMLYTQALSLIGLLTTTAIIYATTTMHIDPALLTWQVAALLVIPFYVYFIGLAAEKAIIAKTEAEQVSFSLLDKGPAPVFTFELDKQNRLSILYSNLATCELFAQKHTMLVGEAVDTLILPEDRDEMSRFCTDILATNELVDNNTNSHIYIRGQDSQGNILKLTCTAIRMHWQNRWIGICFMMDITQRENLQEKLESVHRQGFMSTMVAGIVHDFRNVLNNMIGYAELLHMGSNDDETREQLTAIIAAGDRGSELITHLLKMSKRQEQDIVSTITRGASLSAPLENIIGLSRLQLPSHVQLTCSIGNPLPDVDISIIEIEQITLNLLNNAMQALEKGGQIHVEIRPDQTHRMATAAQPSLCICVTDNGPGINSDNLDNIFKPFWTSRTDKGGSGLGLAMVQRIVKRHHGVITVESTANQATAFSIHIPPAAPAIAHTQVQQPVPGDEYKQDPGTLPALHCLLVDDAPDILKIHSAMLERIGHTVETAENGQLALELFDNHADRFDMIITDYRMPVMDGLQLIEQLRGQNKQIPILMITAYGEDRNLQQASQYGAILMNKPVTIDKLLNGIARTMGH